MSNIDEGFPIFFIESFEGKVIDYKPGGYYTFEYKGAILTIPVFMRKITSVFVKFKHPTEKIRNNPLFNKNTEEINYYTRLINWSKIIEDFKNWFEELL